MKKVKGWWFAPPDNRLSHGDGRKVKVGITHKVEGDIVPCFHGLHVCPKILQALDYATSPIIYKVEGSGIIVTRGNPVNRYACSERTYLAGGIDISNTLIKFARLCVLDVIDLWDALDIVAQYLKTGDKTIMAAAMAAAMDAAKVAVGAAWDAAWATARVAQGDAPWEVAWDTARIAARATAKNAAVDVAWDVIWNAAWEAKKIVALNAARKRQNRRLTRMVNRAIKGRF